MERKWKYNKIRNPLLGNEIFYNSDYTSSMFNDINITTEHFKRWTKLKVKSAMSNFKIKLIRNKITCAKHSVCVCFMHNSHIDLKTVVGFLNYHELKC